IYLHYFNKMTETFAGGIKTFKTKFLDKALTHEAAKEAIERGTIGNFIKLYEPDVYQFYQLAK
ncbi:MAG: hypothetical protein ACXVNF_14495, partial [Neobacillus sp.]